MRPSAATVFAIRPSAILRSCSGASCPGCTAAMPTVFLPRTGSCGCAGWTPGCAWPCCRRSCWSGTIRRAGPPAATAAIARPPTTSCAPSGWPAGWNATTPGIRGSTCWARARWRATVWLPLWERRAGDIFVDIDPKDRAEGYFAACPVIGGADCPGRRCFLLNAPSPPTALTRMPPAGCCHRL